MKRGSRLWQVSVVVAPEAEDAVAEMLQNRLREPAVSHTDVETGRATVAVYAPALPDAPRRLAEELRADVARIRRCGLNAGPGNVSCRRIRREDWAESWKRHFKPLEIGRALLVKAGWHRRRPRKSQAVVVLDPGLSFGTGQHPTTAFCLRQLVAGRRSGTRQSFLDVGTGSGILAIAAAKLGYQAVEALDVDPEAIRVARANARRNRVGERTRFAVADLARMPRRGRRQYHLICANLISSLLLGERDRLVSRVRPDGALILAGILRTEFGAVRRAYEAVGLRLAASRAEKEWCSGKFLFRKF